MFHAVGAIAVLSRICSDACTCFCLFNPWMPVKKIDTRSVRGWCGTLTPGYRAGISLANSGSSTYFANAASLYGRDELKRFFIPSGTTTSFTNGCPSRDTSTHLPARIGAWPVSFSTRICWRYVADHTPIVESLLTSLD